MAKSESSQRDDLQAPVSEYEVFLSFRGQDCRKGIVDVLCSYMTTAGIRVFRDNDELGAGDLISQTVTAIKNSKICVPIFSKTFAESVRCLRQVEAMVKLEKQIIPIFYKVTPEDVKLRTGLFKNSRREQKKKFGREQVKKWEKALQRVAQIKGMLVRDRGFAEFSKSLVQELLIKLKVKTKYVSDHLVNRDNEEEALIKLLEISADDVRLVGIRGMVGIGKTTLAKVLFNKLSTGFDCCSFLEDIRESSKHVGIEHLQRQLLKDLDPTLERFQDIDVVLHLRKHFRDRKVLIFLDDVNEREQVNMIVGRMHSFGRGSRIIITTRDRRALPKEARAFEVTEMHQGEALKLLSRHAFGADSPPSDYHMLSNEVIALTGRFPLAIKVIGSLLQGCEKNDWRAQIDKFKKIPNRNVHEKLKINFEALEDEQKRIFFDIACFFASGETSQAIYTWQACGFFPDEGIEALVSLSLVQIKGNVFLMNGLVRDFGRALVREECAEEPAKQSRIWCEEEGLEVVVMKDKGKENVESLFLDHTSRSLTNEEFAGFRRLRLLKLDGAQLEGDFEHLLPELRWFSWHHCSPDFVATNLSLRKLVVLDLSRSYITESWEGWSLIQMAKDLKVLDLSDCYSLKSTPDLSNNKALERLILRGCHNLAEIHSSIGKLKRLKHLDLCMCREVYIIPESIGYLESVIELDLSQTMIRVLPDSIGQLRKLRVLRLAHARTWELPDTLGGLTSLEILDVSASRLRALPDSVGDLSSLVELDLSQTMIRVLPDSIGQLRKLRVLRLAHTWTRELPDTLGGLTSLEVLDVRASSLTALPDSVGDLSSLVELDLSSIKVVELPNSIGQLRKLRVLRLAHTWTEELPDTLGGLTSLEILDVRASRLTALWDSVGDLSSLVELNLSVTNVSVLPNSIGRLRKLRVLRLAGTRTKELPDTLGGLTSLEILDLSASHLRALPDWVGDLSSLVELDLSETNVWRLPNSIGRLRKLRVLRLFATGTEELPDTLGGLTSLEILDVSASRLTALPDWVGDLSSLVELDLSSIEVVELPNSIGRLWKLRVLRLAYTWIEWLPDTLGGLTSLEILDVSASRLTALPDWVGDLSSLVELDLSSIEVVELPNSIGRLWKLRVLRLAYTWIEWLPDTLGGLTSLEILDLSASRLTALPDSVGDLSSLVELDLSSIEVVELPNSIGRLWKLRVLRLAYTWIEWLPDTLGGLTSLEILDLSASRLTALPDSVGDLSSLVELDLSKTGVGRLPNSIGQLDKLEVLRLDGCKLTELSSSIRKLTKLKNLIASYSGVSTEIGVEIGQISSLRTLSLTASRAAEFPSTTNKLSSLSLLVKKESSFSLGASSQLQDLTLDCLGFKLIAQLPPTLHTLILRNVTPETELSDFSNLKDLVWIRFEDCSLKDVHKLESLGELKMLKSVSVRNCTEELVEFSRKMNQDMDARRTSVKQPSGVSRGEKAEHGAEPNPAVREERDVKRISPEEEEKPSPVFPWLRFPKHLPISQIMKYPAPSESGSKSTMHDAADGKGSVTAGLSQPFHQPKLLESSGSGELVKILKLGCLGLVKPPEVSQWESANEIHLMDNDLTELPSSPRCPSLSALFLEGNQRLRTIPPSFFSHMRALEVLNLSRTRIKSLPDSLFQVVSLKRLFLTECILLGTLPDKIGSLKNLEVLDLEGTKIMRLPEEIKQLVNLTWLEFSILPRAGPESSEFIPEKEKEEWFEESDTLIPSGVLSSLSKIEKLSIDVCPDDKWWDFCVEDVVTDIRSHRQLNTLKFYFPEVELLTKFDWASLKHFRIVVGKHITRILSRLPPDVEAELEGRDKYLKYINGEEPEGDMRDVRKVLKYAEAFFLDRHHHLKKFSDFGKQSFEQLKYCVLGECNKLQVLMDGNDLILQDGHTVALGSLEYLCVYYMKNLETFWRGPVQKGSLSSLKSLTLQTCHKLTSIFTRELLENLRYLKDLEVEDCPFLQSLVSDSDPAHGEASDAPYLPMLRTMSLHYLPALTSISSKHQIAPEIEKLSFYGCPQLVSLDPLSVQKVKKIRGQRSWWNDLKEKGGCPGELDNKFVPVNPCDALYSLAQEEHS